MTTVNVLRGLNNTGLVDRLYLSAPGYMAWSNANFTANPPTGDDPINLILKLLISTGYPSSYQNYSGSGTNYDVYEAGIGVGVPQDQIDLTSFSNVQAQYDWDTANQQVYFHISQPEPAKSFIDQELCRPFGLYLRTGNDGMIRLVRPRHPQKFYVGEPNQQITVRYPATSGTTYNVSLPIGVTTGQQMATNIQTGINNATGQSFSCTYNTGTWTFTLSNANAFDLLASPNSNAGWNTIGWTTTPVSNVTTTTSATARGKFTGSVLTQSDLFGVQQLDNRDDQISSVVFMFDYDADSGVYRTQRRYVNSEAVNLGDVNAANELIVQSRGLISAGANTSPWIVNYSVPGSGCDPVITHPATSVGVDADTWSQLYAQHLLDRYKQPPLKFSARLKWNWNTLEVGDVVQVNYTIPGVFIDYERNATTLSNRLFEIVELHPNFDGSLDATFLGHRYVSY